MESDYNLNFSEKFKLSQKRAKEQGIIIDEVVSSINSVVKEWVKLGRDDEKKTKQNLLNYLKKIQDIIAKLDGPEQICSFLRAEKRECASKAIEAKIIKDGFLRKYYQAAIDFIICPILEEWQDELNCNDSRPPSKHILPVNDTPKPLIVELELPPENKSSLIPMAETGNSDGIEVESELPPEFAQIECDATKVEILNYFMILAKEKNEMNDKYYMEEEDVKEFVNKNFAVFKSVPTNIYFSINLNPTRQKAKLRDFVYKFHKKYDWKAGTDKMKYVRLLIDNFEMFKNDDPKILSSNMGETKGPIQKSIIPIEKYL